MPLTQGLIMRTGQRRKRSVNWKRNPYKSRIVQKSKGLEYAFVSETMDQATDFTRSPEHLLKAAWGSIHKRRINWEGFKYNPKIHPKIRQNKTALLISNSQDNDFNLRIPGVIDFVNQIENYISMPLSVARSCYDPPSGYNDIWYIESSKRWMNAPTMLSFYTLCIAIGMVHEPGAVFRETIEAIKTKKLHPYDPQDISTWDYSKETIEKLINRGDQKTFLNNAAGNYPSSMPIGRLEDGKVDLSISGITYYVKRFQSKKSKLLIPYWPIICLSGIPV